VCGGFAYIKANSDCDVMATAAVPLAEIDAEAVAASLAKVRCLRSGAPKMPSACSRCLLALSGDGFNELGRGGGRKG
jgi:hypothetical protein